MANTPSNSSTTSTSELDSISTGTLSGKHILLGITGGIAAYKTPMLVRQLRQLGAQVQVVMTGNAAQFVTATSLQAVSGLPVRTDLWDPAAEASMGHIELARWADLVLVAPATANTMALLSQGQAPDLLTTLYLATQAPVLIAPAMNQAMWSHPAVQRNVAQLRSDGANIIGPDAGEQACGDTGPGRMVEPEDLAAAAVAILSATATTSSAATGRASDPSFTQSVDPQLSGCRVMITAGPTREAIDPVRYISNHSSGKQGYALAAAAVAQGAKVTLVSGPVNLDCPLGVERVDVTSAQEMQRAVQQRIAKTDIFIGVAAVADYRPAHTADKKIKKTSDTGSRSNMELVLVENPDIIATVAAHGACPFVVGFAAETHNTHEFARGKLKRKKLDMIVVNDVSDTSIGFGSDNNAATMIWAAGERSLARAPKAQLAAQIMAEVAQQYVAQLATTNPQPAVN